MDCSNPWDHYIPVREDLSDVEDAVLAMEDIDAAKSRVAACDEAIVENPSLRYSHLAREVMRDVERLAEGRGFRETNVGNFEEAAASHRFECNRWMAWMESQPIAYTGID